jgi:microcystin-dependent protein
MIIKDLDVLGDFNIIPKGTIVMWNGTTIPSGWILCDGTNGTPDLRGRCVIGIGTGKDALGKDLTTRSLGDKSGEEDHVLAIQELPAHSHGLSLFYEHARSFAGEEGSDKPVKTSCGNCTQNHPRTDSTGSTSKHNNMPPFYVLSYIMKL